MSNNNQKIIEPFSFNKTKTIVFTVCDGEQTTQ